MRITGGKARGIQLKTPRGNQTRPATDRLREAIFSSLGPSINNCTVADLFAGSGSYGLEAISRGAASATFFENERNALACLKANITAVLRSTKMDTHTCRALSTDVYQLHKHTNQYDLIFLDPPYHTIAQNLQTLFTRIIAPIATPDAQVIFELPGNLAPEILNWQITRRIGKTGKDKPTAAIFERS